MPDAFEQEIQNTEVKGQDILKAEAETRREQVKFVTNQNVAALAVNATLEEKYGKANITMYEAYAYQQTIKNITNMTAIAFKNMKQNLTFDNE